MEEDVQDVSFTFTVEHPALWSAEQPNLYEAEIALLREGDLAERTSLKVGLRKFELEGSPDAFERQAHRVQGRQPPRVELPHRPHR